MKRRSFTATMAALALAGCDGNSKPNKSVRYRVRRGDRWVEVDITSSGDGGVVSVAVFNNPNGPAEVKNYDTPVPIETILPPNPNDSQQIQDGLNAAIDISVDTIFALGSRGQVLQMDLSTGAAVRTLTLTEDLVTGVASPANQFLYLLGSAPLNGVSFAPSLRIVNLTTFQETGFIPLPTTMLPWSIAVTPNGKYLYVAGALAAQTVNDPGGVACHIIDTASRTIVKTLTFVTSFLINRPEIVITRDGGLAFLTTGNGVACIDVLTQTHSHTIPETPSHIAVDAWGTVLYLAPVRQGLALYDIPSSTFVKHIAIERLATMAMALSQDGATMLISRIPLDPVTQRNGFPERVVVELATGKLTVYPWQGASSPPVTVGTLISVPMP